MQSNTILFGTIARLLGQECRRLGLRAPAFRSPPRASGAVRTIRRWPDGGAVVLVRVRGRPAEALAADMVEGVLVANRVPAMRRHGLRAALCAAVTDELGWKSTARPPGRPGPPMRPRVPDRAGVGP